MGGMRWVVPLAAAAALFTLVCSTYLLSMTGWKKSTRFRVEVGNAASASTSLLEYMHDSTSSISEAAMDVTSSISEAALDVMADAFGADASPPVTTPTPAAAAPPVLRSSFAESEYEGSFLFARDEPIPANDPAYLRKLLKSLLGMAVLLKRTLVLPAAL